MNDKEKDKLNSELDGSQDLDKEVKEKPYKRDEELATEEENIAKEPSVGYGMEYTYADYMKFSFDEMVELIRGKLFRMSPAPKSFHQEILGNLHGVFYPYFKKFPCKLYLAPFDVVLPIADHDKNKSSTVVQPDLCIICDITKIDEAGCFGAPDFIIEIISESTSRKDTNEKFDVYEEAGVREYWIVFPKEEIINCYLLEDGKYRLKRTYAKGDIASLNLFPGLTFLIDDVFNIKDH